MFVLFNSWSLFPNVWLAHSSKDAFFWVRNSRWLMIRYIGGKWYCIGAFIFTSGFSKKLSWHFCNDVVVDHCCHNIRLSLMSYIFNSLLFCLMGSGKNKRKPSLHNHAMAYFPLCQSNPNQLPSTDTDSRLTLAGGVIKVPNTPICNLSKFPSNVQITFINTGGHSPYYEPRFTIKYTLGRNWQKILLLWASLSRTCTCLICIVHF